MAAGMSAEQIEELLHELARRLNARAMRQRFASSGEQRSLPATTAV
jgi:hypothetical protein